MVCDNARWTNDWNAADHFSGMVQLWTGGRSRIGDGPAPTLRMISTLGEQFWAGNCGAGGNIHGHSFYHRSVPLILEPCARYGIRTAATQLTSPHLDLALRRERPMDRGARQDQGSVQKAEVQAGVARATMVWSIGHARLCKNIPVGTGRTRCLIVVIGGN